MAVNYRLALGAAVLAVADRRRAMVTAMADGIDQPCGVITGSGWRRDRPGLWKVITRTETGGVIGPPHESLQIAVTGRPDPIDLTTTFTPVAPTRLEFTVNSASARRSNTILTGDKLTWRLTCKGQLDMELTGEFNFDSPHHYSATVRTKAQMGE